MKTLIYFLSNILTKDKNTSSIQNSDKSNVRTEKNKCVKCCSIEAMTMITKLKANDKNNANNTDLRENMFDVRIFKDELYIHFKNFIINNSDGEKLPSNKIIENSLKISERQRKEYRNKGVEEGYILKKNKTTYIFNINRKGEEDDK